MKKPITKQGLITHLVEKNGFKQIAPQTFLYKDNVDVITVSFRDGVIIITGDGVNVIPSWKIIPITNWEGFWDNVLQEILVLF
jgi:hypothetical protein